MAAGAATLSTTRRHFIKGICTVSLGQCMATRQIIYIDSLTSNTTTMCAVCDNIIVNSRDHVKNKRGRHLFQFAFPFKLLATSRQSPSIAGWESGGRQLKQVEGDAQERWRRFSLGCSWNVRNGRKTKLEQKQKPFRFLTVTDVCDTPVVLTPLTFTIH